MRRGQFSPIHYLKSIRPQLETLEDRLPPGDALPGGLMAGTMFGSAFALFRAEPNNARITLLQPAKLAPKPLPVESPASESATAWTRFVAAHPATAATAETMTKTTANPASAGWVWADDLLADLEPAANAAPATGRFVHAEAASGTSPGALDASDPAPDFRHAADATAAPTPAASANPLPGQAILEAVARLDAGLSGPAGGGTDIAPVASQPPSNGSILETLGVPTAHGLGVNSHTVLRAGHTYTLIARGDFQYGSLRSDRADAQYRNYANPSNRSTDGVTPIGIEVSGVTVTGGHPRWGVYHAAHTYTITVTGQGQPLHAFYQDAAGAYGTHQGTMQVLLLDGSCPLPLDTPPTKCCGQNGDLVQTLPGADGGYEDSRAYSAGNVRYADGGLRLSTDDLSSDGFGTPWGVSRTWFNLNTCVNAGPGSNSPLGFGMAVSQQAYLANPSHDPFPSGVIVVTSSTNFHEFDLNPDGVTYRSSIKADTETLSGGMGVSYRFTDTVGDKFTFNDFSGALSPQGVLTSFTDPAGNRISLDYDNGTGQLINVTRRAALAGSNTITEQYHYSYQSGGLLNSVTLLRWKNSDNPAIVRQVNYLYYSGNETYGGIAGDLMAAIISDPNGQTLDTKYYRYYTNSSDMNNGRLSLVFNPQSFDRMFQAKGMPNWTRLSNLTDDDLRTFADYAFQYDGAGRIAQEVVQGAGCTSCGTGGLGTYAFSYGTNTNMGHVPGYNSWNTVTTETLPDGNHNIVYANFKGMAILKVFQSGAQQWATYYQYDSDGRTILKAAPSALSGFDPRFDALIDQNQVGDQGYLRAAAGLIQSYVYGASTTATEGMPGDATGYLKHVQIQRGRTGTPIKLSEFQYFAHQATIEVIYPMASATVYRNPNGTGAETTLYVYTWYNDPMSQPTARMMSKQTTRPAIPGAENGPGTGRGQADQETTNYDIYGRATQTTDADGFINQYAYDQATSAVTQVARDVNNLNLVTNYQVDILGRPTKITEPNGPSHSPPFPQSITYLVYNDPKHEIRTYPGWNPATNLPTGPTRLMREDRAHYPVYTETLTMAAVPHLTGNLPDGTENVANVQTLSRDLTNDAGQVTETDAYLDVGAGYVATPTIPGAHFYATQYDYDARGRRNRILSPTQTINRTVYDGLNRTVGSWVGTNDTGATDTDPTGGGNPNNNMVQLSGNVYDGGNVGDSNLTGQTQYPHGTGDTANPPRVTNHYYDWRDRLVYTKGGAQTNEADGIHRPIFYRQYDNLDEVTTSQRYDGDGVNLVLYDSNGVPQPPAASLLRAQTQTAYDEQGRVYLTSTFHVDPGGTVSTTALTTNRWYDHRGNLLKTAAPGGLVRKMQYDGAGRTTADYATDGLEQGLPMGWTAWQKAGSVAGDNVLSQTETQYDSNDNVILVTQRARFHNETLTGALSDPNGGAMHTQPKARVSYVANYYDLANRLTDTVNLGTNGGMTYMWSTTIPTRSDAVLITHQDYNAAGWVSLVTDPRGLQNQAIYDLLGRTVKTVEAYDGGLATNSTNKATEYTYDGMNHLLTLQADLPGGGVQQTKYVYGISNPVGSGLINSNDLLAQVQYPDPVSGQPNPNDVETYNYDNLSETTAKTDRNMTIHAYTFDVLGRPISDAVTIPQFSSVDRTIKQLTTAYDTYGNASLFTSLDGGGNVKNQVQRTYNGFGQLTAEYQSHSGVVNPATTPVVQYAYSLMQNAQGQYANHNRLKSITYPNGRILRYEYTTPVGSVGVYDAVSRVSFLADDNAGTVGTHLEEYAYLGLDTVVKRAHPQPGIDLTYIQQANDPNANHDAGDQYTGLDRFGRVIDQYWTPSTGGTPTDRFQYGYDRDRNRLYRNNLVNANFGELYHANGANNGYDTLNQLVTFNRGILNGTKDTITNPSRVQSWSLDVMGNWSSITTVDNGSSTTQTRAHNKQNQLIHIDPSTSLGFDGSGNTTADETGKIFKYDAWNRLMLVTSGGTGVAAYIYDALGRRILENNVSAKDLYYSSTGQVLEEQIGGQTQSQYVWSSVYIDALVRRDQNGQSLYVQQDANFNVTALIDQSGAVVERYAYDPYGSTTVMTPTWHDEESSSVGWIYLHQGGRLDVATGLLYFRNRDYSPTLGRWMQQDPIGYNSGDIDLYRYVNDSPISLVDPLGLRGPAPGPTWAPPYGGPQNPITRFPADQGTGLPENRFPRNREPLPSLIPDPNFWRQKQDDWETHDLIMRALLNGVSWDEIQSVTGGKQYGCLDAFEKKRIFDGLRNLIADKMKEYSPDKAKFFKDLKEYYDKNICNTDKDPCKGESARGPYSFLAYYDGTTISAGKEFTKDQKDLVRMVNLLMNGGTLKSDDPGDPYQELVWPPSISPQTRPKPGVPPNNAQVDHIIPRSRGGTNSLCNARVISRKLNGDKGDD